MVTGASVFALAPELTIISKMLFVTFLIAKLSLPARLANASVCHISASAVLAIVACELAVLTEVARSATFDQYTSQ